jgi:hypothetical protein
MVKKREFRPTDFVGDVGGSEGNMLEKIDARNTAGLVIFAMKNKVVD